MNYSQFPPDIRFDFPLPRPHCGITLGNGNLELLVWGDEFLCLTIACAEFGVDDREKSSEPKANSTAGRPWLLAGDANNWRELLANAPEQASPVGSANLELRFASEIRPVSGTLRSDGILQIKLSDGRTVTLECAMDEEVAWLEGISDAQWELRASHEGEQNISAPLEIQIDDGCGLIWERAENDSLAVMVRQCEQILFIATAVGETEEAAKAAVTRARAKPDINPIYYWKQYWRTTPRVAWPDAQLQNFWNVALFRRAQLHATENSTPAQNGSAIDFIAAMTEELVQFRDNEIHILPAIPRQWRELSFDGIRSEGTFTVGADVENGAVTQVRVKSEKGGELRLHPNAQTKLEREMAAGEDWIWQNS